jgi:flagellar hook protein FlgE
MANQGNIGGTNPTQIGLGIRLSTVDVIHSRAAFQRTDRETDMMINGDGFFIVAQQNPDTGEFEPFYTRAGNFDIDNDGYLVTSSGLFVLGTSFELETGVVDIGSPAIPARASLTPGQFTAAFPAQGVSPTQTIADAAGYTMDALRARFVGTPAVPGVPGDPGDPDATPPVPPTLPIDPIPAVPPTDTSPIVIAAGSVWAGGDGSGRPRIPASDITLTVNNFEVRGVQFIGYHNPVPINNVPADGFRPGDIIPAGTFQPVGDQVGNQPPAQVTITTDNIHLWNDGQPRLLADGRRWPLTPRPPFNAVAQRFPIFGIVQGAENPGLNKIRMQTERLIIPDVDLNTGLPLGAPEREPDWTDERYMQELENWLEFLAETAATEMVGLPGFAVADNGDVSVIVANRKVIIGRVAMAMFSNPAGLEKGGNSLYRESASSGPAVVTEAFMDGAGKIDGGGLEMSNVDLANEFTDMIVTQRGFQANSRIITVSDTMLEELVNLKR